MNVAILHVHDRGYIHGAAQADMHADRRAGWHDLAELAQHQPPLRAVVQQLARQRARIGIADDRRGAHRGLVAAIIACHDAGRDAVLLQHPRDAGAQPHLATAFHDCVGKHLRKMPRSALGIGAADEEVGVERHHGADADQRRVVGTIGGNAFNEIARRPVRHVAVDEAAPRPVHPRGGQREFPGKGHRVGGRLRRTGKTVVIARGGVHRAIDLVDLVEQPGDARRVLRELPAEKVDQAAPFAGHVEAETVIVETMIEPPPRHGPRLAETFQENVQRAVRPPAGEIVHAGIETEQKSLTGLLIARAPDPVMAEPTRAVVLFEDDDLESLFRQQCCCR